MDAQNTATLRSAEQVGLDLEPFQDLINDFEPLKEAHEARADYVAAIQTKVGQQEGDPTATTDKDGAREKMARATVSLSQRAVAYALAEGDLGLKQRLTLTYADLREGDADEDVRHVRELIAAVHALPEPVRTRYRLTPELLQAPEAAARAFEQLDKAQDAGQGRTRLATLELPELLAGLRKQLRIMQALTASLADDPTEPRYRSLALAFRSASKRRAVATKSRDTSRPRIIRTLRVSLPDHRPARLAHQTYGPAYTLTVENRSAHALQLWMAQKDLAKTTPVTCPAGQVTTLTRAALGPETATYLVAQFEGDAGGEATVVVRRVAE